MKKEDFKIGEEFFTGSGKWLCTDIGTRVIIAIKLDKDNKDLYNTHPSLVTEVIFDEYDFGGCDLTDRFKEFRKQRMSSKRPLGKDHKVKTIRPHSKTTKASKK